MGDGSGQDGSWLVKVAGCTIYGTQNFSIELKGVTQSPRLSGFGLSGATKRQNSSSKASRY